MAILLFRLRNVPEDEADEVRSLLTEHDIDFYETSPGNWGISMPGLWLRKEEQAEEARSLLKDYQRQRYRHAREEYEQKLATGEQRSLTDSFRDHPLRFIAYTAIIAVILYISISVFFSFEV